MVILDTDVIIDHLRQKHIKETPFMKLTQRVNGSFGLSVISIQELYAGKSTRNKKGEEDLLLLLSQLELLAYTKDIAELAGKVVRDSKLPIRFADAVIAASTIIHKGELFTLNKKHYKGIEGLRLFEFKI